jgi:hypothetical protein
MPNDDPLERIARALETMETTLSTRLDAIQDSLDFIGTQVSWLAPRDDEEPEE